MKQDPRDKCLIQPSTTSPRASTTSPRACASGFRTNIIIFFATNMHGSASN